MEFATAAALLAAASAVVAPAAASLLLAAAAVAAGNKMLSGVLHCPASAVRLFEPSSTSPPNCNTPASPEAPPDVADGGGRPSFSAVVVAKFMLLWPKLLLLGTGAPVELLLIVGAMDRSEAEDGSMVYVKTRR
jgi:hypothetical protein